jgi:eukaryotic-like serine/threonine-protein kinase
LIGTRLGAYEITAKLGAGGMGEVWRARDTKLGREVALKVLPQTLAADGERLQRFEREAQLLASLNHPHIAAIYGIEDSTDTKALVLELVEGETLQERIERGAIPLEDALPIARQIAEALEAAHERGVIHRDLKPANVKIQPDGTVKVLDFGLAKALDPTASGSLSPGVSPTLMNSPTLTAAGTALGVILGTAAYMSPEQAKAKAVDKRADVWSFGVVLWEMLSGRRLFERESVPETLGAIFQQEIDLGALPPATPGALRELLARCLERDPRERLRDIGEARIALAHPAPRAEVSVPATGGSSWRERAAWLTAIASAAIALVAVLAPRAGVGAGSGGPSPQVALARLTDLPGAESNPDLSPDGRQFVYDRLVGGNRDIYLQRVGGDRAIDLTTTSAADDSQAAFSPDGQYIAFRSEREGGGLFLMGATGESVRRLTEDGYNPAWAPDGRTLAYSTEPVDDPYSRSVRSQIHAVEIATGKTRVLVDAIDAIQPAWSADGTQVAFWSNQGGQRDLWMADARPGAAAAPVAITADAATDWSPRWSADGRWLYFSSDRGGAMGMWRLAVGAGSTVSGAPQAVVTGMRGLGHVSVSRDGRELLVMAYDRTSDVALYTIGAQRTEGLRQTALLPRQSLQWCSLAPDAQWLACSLRGAREDLVILRSDGSELRRLTDDDAKDRLPKWSPDGRTISFISTRSGIWNYWLVQSDGSGLRRLSDLQDFQGGAAWSPDGKRILVWQAPHFYLYDATLTMQHPEPFEIEGLDSPGLEVASWLAGDRILIVEGNAAGRALAPAILDLRRRTVDRLPPSLQGRAFGSIAGMLPGGEFVMRAKDGITAYDPARHSATLLLPAEEDDVLDLTPDGRTLQVERKVIDADLWLVTLPEAGH